MVLPQMMGMVANLHWLIGTPASEHERFITSPEAMWSTGHASGN
jgi:hypothetical protein